MRVLSVVVTRTFLLFCIYGRVCSSRYDGRCDDHRTEAMQAADEAEYAAAADVVGGQQADTLFWFDEAVFEDSTLLLGHEGKDHHHLYAATETARCLQVESNFPVEESARISPRNLQSHRVDVEAEPTQQVHQEAKGGIAVVDVPATTFLEPEQRMSAPAPVAVPPENVSIEGNQSLRS